MPEHDPIKFASALSAKLASRSRHVCVFLGAGSAKACKLPDVAELQKLVVSALNESNKKEFERQLVGRDLEGALTRLRRIAALVDGKEQFDGLTSQGARDLDANVCREIVKALDLEKADLDPVCRFAAWAGRADYNLPVEVFTVNYDLLLETALDSLRVPYFDGFVGTIRAGFHTELIEGEVGSHRDRMPAFFLRLWKLHGSVNWVWNHERKIVRLGHPIPDKEAAAIFPSDTKYEESRRVPFVVLQDHFRRSMHMPESLILISGYSFSDAHLNDMIFDAAARFPRSEFQAFCYSEIPDELAERAITTPNLQVANGREGIVGGVRANWKNPEDPPADLWVDGQFGFRDFKYLSSFLARSASRETDNDSLADLLKSALNDSGKGGTTVKHG